MAQRLTAQLVAMLESGRLPVSTAQLKAAHHAHVQARAYVLLLEHALLQTTEVLSCAGVRLLVLKGPAHAHLDYAHPADRTYGDLDILVDPGQYTRAIAALRDGGHLAVQGDRERPTALEAEFDKGRTLVSPNGVLVDIHHMLADPPFGLAIDTDRLFLDAEPFHIRGRRVLALGREERLLHSCLHAAIGGLPPRFISLRDIVLQARHSEVDWHRFDDLVRAWRVGAVVSLANELARSHLSLWRVPMDLACLGALRDTRRARTLLVASSWNDRRRNQALRFGTLAAAHGIRARLRLVRGVLLLDRAELAKRGGFTSLAGW